MVATSSPDAPTPIGPTGAAYEISLLAQHTSSVAIAQTLENLMANVYTDFSNGQTASGAAALAKFDVYAAGEALIGHIDLTATETFAEMDFFISDYLLGKSLSYTGDVF